MSTVVKSWLVLVLIFIAGAVSGAALSLVLAPHFLHPRMRPHDPARIKQDMMDGLTRELQLTPDQQGKIQPIIGDAARQMHDVHQDEVQRISQIFKLTNDQIAPLLTADQKAKLDKLEAEGGASPFFGHPPRPWGEPDSRGGGNNGPPEGDPGPGQPPPPPPGAPDEAQAGEPPPPPPASPSTNAPPR
jgi:Spy/CpxP family protein refolding chaperone